MNLRRYCPALAGLLLAVLLVGCASIPEGIEPLPEEPLTRAEVLADPEATKGQAVVWGGVIAAVENTRDGTRLEIVARPLNREARPREVDQSEGRFRAYIDDFLDPQVYEEGREVTVRGRLAGIEEGTIGEFDYRFVRVDAQTAHLWAKRPPPRDRYYYDPWGPPGYMGPYWRPHPYYWRHDPWRYDPWRYDPWYW